jgi:hypothetical protein
MARFRKKVKRYERWILIGVVIVILATISVTGIQGRGCSKAGAWDGSGSFLVAPGKRKEVTSDEYLAARVRYERYYRQQFPVTVRYDAELPPAARTLPVDLATWIHVVLVEAAKEAGYRVGDAELADGVKRAVGIRLQGMVPGRSRRTDPALFFRPEVYPKVVENLFGGTKAEFEETVREVLLKDKLLGPLVDSARFSRSAEEAYDGWKSTRERVALAWVAVPAEAFLDRATKEETTREAISRDETALRRLSGAANRVRDSMARIESVWKPAHGGRYPADEAELKKPEGSASGADELDEDPWNRPLVYHLVDGKPVVRSLGPDGALDTKDDVSPETVRTIDALSTVRRVADALVQWHGSAKEFPAALDRLTTPPPSSAGARTVPPLTEVPKDPWGRDLVYEPSPPVLLSLGGDGQRGTPDDVAAELAEGKAVVRLPASLDPWIDRGAKDAAGKPLEHRVGGANPLVFEVVGAGPDGAFGTEDDLSKGNEEEISRFFAGRRGQPDFTVPQRRTFEAVYVHLPRVPDEVLKEAWERFPAYRPKEDGSKDDPYHRFQSVGNTYYRSVEVDAQDRPVQDTAGKPVEIDPADPEKGHGADLVPKETKGKAWLVPAPTAFPGLADVEPKKDDALHERYVRRGWRRILLREMFFENLLNDWLRQARESQRKRKEWEEKGKSGPEPEEVTFTTLLASVADLQPGEVDVQQGARFLEYLKTEKPLTREEWEALPSIGELNVTNDLSRVTKDGEYPLIPTVIKKSAGRVILRNLKFEAARPRTLDEEGVREKVLPLYRKSRAMDLAVAELERVRDAANAPRKPEEPAAPRDVRTVAAEAAAKRGFPLFQGETPPFVGRDLAPPFRAPPGATPEQVADARRAHFVRESGYDVVKAGGPTGPAQVGAVAHRILRDDDERDGGEPTQAAYLVQVKSREDTPPEEFHGKPYLEWLEGHAYSRFGERGQLLGDPGFVTEHLVRLLADFDAVRAMFDLKTAQPLSLPRDRRRVD